MKLRKLCVFAFAGIVGMGLFSCSDDNNGGGGNSGTDADYVGEAVGNFSKEEWYPGGELGTTDNVSAGCYEDETPATEQLGLMSEFKKGEALFERNFNSNTAPFNGLGPAALRKSCLDCHPGYGHGKRQEGKYRSVFGNGYLLAIYTPEDGANSNDGNYITEVTGMPQTLATTPFLPPIDESRITIEWKNVTAMESGLAMRFPDNGEAFELTYPEVNIPKEAFNTYPQPDNIAVRLESTIGVIGTGLLPYPKTR